jgi:hypothetical protein
MTLSEQIAILLEAVKDGFLRPADIIQWADTIIVAMEKPPAWLIELSTLDPSKMVELVSLLRAQTPAPLTVRRQIQLIVLAHDAGLLSLKTALSRLFEVSIFDLEEQPLDADGEHLVDALVELDCQEDPDVIEPPLLAKFESLFREFLTDANDVASVLPWKFKKAA